MNQGKCTVTILRFMIDMPWKMVQTQIRLLVEEQPDQSTLFAISSAAPHACHFTKLSESRKVLLAADSLDFDPSFYQNYNNEKKITYRIYFPKLLQK